MQSKRLRLSPLLCPSSHSNTANFIMLSRPVPSTAMGKDYQKKGKESSQGKGTDPKRPFGIPKYQHFPKASLAPYPDEDGNALWLGDNESLDELLAPNNILASRSQRPPSTWARRSSWEGRAPRPSTRSRASGKERLSAAKTLNLGN